jgi:RNA polymerase sigma-70 factor, ECF subfamily
VDDERQLIEQAQAGQLHAFESLVAIHGGSIFRYIRAIVGDQHHAEDIAQQVWVNVHQKLRTYDREKGAFSTWTFRIARNLSLNHRRAAQRSPIQFGTPVPESHDALDTSEQAMVRERFARLDSALAQLPDHQRSAWTLAEIEGLTQSQIAEIESVPEGTVKSRVSRAKATLKKILENHTEVER